VDFIFDPSLVLYLPFYELDGASFQSKDAYGHLCTVTGAVWRPRGRYFDGVDDVITIPQSSSLNDLSEYTGLFWVRFDSGYGDIYPRLFSKDGDVIANYLIVRASDGKVQTSRQFATTSAVSRSTEAVPAETWLMVGVSLTPDKYLKIYINGIEITAYDTYQQGVGVLTADASYDMLIGNRTGTGGDLHGVLGEVSFYSRCLTPLEIQHNYLATKWRYR